MSLALTGVAEALAKLALLATDARQKTVPLSLGKQARYVRDVARQNAPASPTENPDSGRLKRAIFAKRAKKREQPNEIRFEIGIKRGKKRDDKKGAFYGLFVELGTVKQPAQRFLRPALNDNAGVVAREFAKDFKARVSKLASKIK